ncbi:MAG TPA: hypothetical protein VMW56_26090 [Candidatus Margulisiibacteriota bacterium]|nr:hypothetical protein [Candidatus Margulisiibacteriota bacterium]
MEFLDLPLFLAVTFGHLALTPYWLQRFWGAAFSGREEALFYAVVFGFGSLQAVLHVLACTIGISLAAGVVALGLLHAVALALLYARRPSGVGVAVPPPTQRPRPQPAAAVGRELLDQSVAVAGTSAVLACILSWLFRASQSLQILGIDSTHYHAPYAINYAHGVNLFGFAATPHLYPMGASVLGAWCFDALASPLLLDLTNLLPFLLLFVALAYLFTLLTDAPGLEWACPVFLLLFTGRLFRVSLFISADLFYCATCVALFTLLCRFWVRDRIAPYDWLALGLLTGMLVSSKPQGVLSAAVLIGIGGVALVVRRLLRRAPLTAGLQPTIGIGISLCVLLVAAGGVWLLRNWVRFGSPLAPAGLSLFGVTIFPGLPARSADAPMSVLSEMRSTPGYDLWARFRFYTRDWIGAWPSYFALGFLVLVAEATYQLATRRRLRAGTVHRLFALLLLAVAFAVHAYLLAGVAFSGLEWLRGQTLRFILPFFALYALIMVALLFADSLPWTRSRHLKWLAAAGLAVLLADYNRLTSMPLQWNRSYGVEDMIDYRLLPVALVVVLPWFVEVAPWRRYLAYASAVMVGACVAIWVQQSLLRAQPLGSQAAAQFERQLSRFQSDGNAPTPYRGVLYRALVYQRQHHLRCTRSRFFTVSRFDFPIDLQDPGFTNVVFDVQNDVTRVTPLLRSDGPGREPCDFIVAVHTTTVDKDTTYPAVSDADIVRLLLPRGTLQPIGDSGRYRVYHVRR